MILSLNFQSRDCLLLFFLSFLINFSNFQTSDEERKEKKKKERKIPEKLLERKIFKDRIPENGIPRPNIYIYNLYDYTYPRGEIARTRRVKQILKLYEPTDTNYEPPVVAIQITRNKVGVFYEGTSSCHNAIINSTHGEFSNLPPPSLHRLSIYTLRLLCMPLGQPRFVGSQRLELVFVT